MTRNEMKRIAIGRMEALKLFKPCITAFAKRDEIQMSEPTGGLYEISGEEKLRAVIEDFETNKVKGAMVYHVIHTYTEFGELYNLLYVSPNEDRSEDEELEDIKDGYVFVWCENVDYPDFSEFGTIGVYPKFGGLVRNA